MLIKITNRCNFECWHCFQDCKKDGEHMSNQVFNDIIKFISKYKKVPLLISGGEPTLHYNFRGWILRLYEKFQTAIIIASNGCYLDKNGNVPKEFKFPFKTMLQITNDDRYYPQKINARFNHPDYEFVSRLPYKNLRKCKKLIGKNIEFEKTVFCGNIRLNVELGILKNFQDILFFLTSILRVCLPYIDIYGNIYIGESDICKSIGTIYDSDKTLINNIKNMNCNNCGNFESQMKIASERLIDEFFKNLKKN